MKITIEPDRLTENQVVIGATVASRFFPDYGEKIVLIRVSAPSFVGQGYESGIEYHVVMYVPKHNMTPPREEVTGILTIIDDDRHYDISIEHKELDVPMPLKNSRVDEGSISDDLDLQVKLVFEAITTVLAYYAQRLNGRADFVLGTVAKLQAPTSE